MLFYGKLPKISHFYPQQTTKKSAEISTDTENCGRKRKGWKGMVLVLLMFDGHSDDPVNNKRNEEMANEREGGEQKRARAASWFLCRVQVCKKRRKRGSKACQRAAERTSEGAEERRGRE